MDDDCYRRGSMRILKNLVGVLLLVFVWSLFIGILTSRNNIGFATSTSMQNSKRVAAVEMKKHVPVNPNPIYASKRRVPSGPDPIHNRHARETSRAPGHD